METVTVSSKYQVVIPSRLRESMKIQAGQKMLMIEYDGRLEMIPIIPIRDAYGMFLGLDTTVERDSEERV